MPQAKTDQHVSAPSRVTGSVDDPAVAVPPSSPPSSVSSPAFCFELSLVEARGLFTVDDRDDPFGNEKKKKLKTPASAGMTTSSGGTTEIPKSAATGLKSASKKKKGGTAGAAEEEPPFHCFIQYTPFEPVLVETPPPPPTANKEKKHRRDVDDDTPAGPQYLHSLQTQPTEDSTEPKFHYSHIQPITNKEFFLDAIHLRPLTLHVYQYFPLDAGKKKAAGKPGSSGKDASPPPPPATASASRKKKKGQADEEEVKPFGDLDPDCVVKLGEVHVSLHAFLRGHNELEGWFPVHMPEETLHTARGIATARGKTALGMPEIFIKASIDRPIVADEEREGANTLTVSVDRIERMPNWILDCAQMEAIEAHKRHQASIALDVSGDDRPGTSAAGPKEGVSALPLTPPTPTRKGTRKDKDANALDEFAEKDYTDTFTLVYNLPLSATPSLQKSIRMVTAGPVSAPVNTPLAALPDACIVPIIGLNESDRSEVAVRGSWVQPRREVIIDELPSAKKSKSAADTTPARTKKNAAGSGRTSPPHTEESTEKQYSEPTVWNPSLPRASLSIGHSRTAYLTASAVSSWKSTIDAGQPFLFQLDHVRTPLDEKLVEAGRIHQSAMTLVDLRPLLKPGATELDAYFTVRQTSPPLPARMPEEKKKRGGTAAKRATMTSSGSFAGGVTGDDGLPAAPIPPETFDESRTFMRVTFRLAKPLTPRRAPLNIANVLPVSAGSGVPASASVPQHGAALGAELLAPPRRITAGRDTGATRPHTQPPLKDNTHAMEYLNKRVEEIVVKMVHEWESAHPHDAHAIAPPQVPISARGAANQVSVLPAAPSAGQPDSPLRALLARNSLSLHFASSLRPALRSLIASTFATSLFGSTPLTAHRANQLLATLASEADKVLRATLQVRRATGETEIQRQARRWLDQRREFEEAGTLAGFAELHGDLNLANLHHQHRLTVLLTMFQSSPHGFPSGSAFDPRDLVSGWYSYGCFLLRRQNGPGDLVSGGVDDSIQDVFEHISKTGSIDEGENAAIDLAEECFRQCLRYDAQFVPALVNITLILLEQNKVEASLEYIHRAISLVPDHTLLLAVQGLYHELAEEDDESLGAYHRASEVMHQVLNQQGEQASGTDGLLHALLGQHGRGLLSLPLYHSQSVHLLLSRFLSTFGFRRLGFIVLSKQVREQDARGELEEAEQARLAQCDARELNEGDTTNFQIGRADYYQFGPYLEMADWYAANTDLYETHTLPTLRKAQAIINSKSVEQHHAHSLLYAFATQGNIYYANKSYDEAAANYRAYLSMMDEKNMNIYLDPAVLCNASSLYLLKHILSESLHLATLLVTHPTHTRDPFLWCLFGDVLSASGKFQLAEEAISEAITKDARNARGWAAYAATQLRRIKHEHHHMNRDSHGRAPPLTHDDFEEARHAFDRCLESPAPCQDPAVLVELGRLWFQHGFISEAEQCYTRALLVRADPAILTKLRWLQQQKSGQQPERETKAATTMQAAIRGAIARRQAKKKKLQMAAQAHAQQHDEEKLQPAPCR